MFKHGSGKGQEFRPLTAGDSLIGLASNSSSRGQGFQAANITAGATLTSPVYRHMPKLSSSSVVALQDTTINDNTSPDAGAHCQIDDIFAVLTSSKEIL